MKFKKLEALAPFSLMTNSKHADGSPVPEATIKKYRKKSEETFRKRKILSETQILIIIGCC